MSRADWLSVLAQFLLVCAVCALLPACTSSGDFKELLQDVKANCHTQIDAQLAANMTGIGGSGHFQQECWPEGSAPMNTTKHDAP